MSQSSQSDTTQRQQVRRSSMTVFGLLEVCGVLLCTVTVTGFLARLWWIFELTSHFRPHWAAALVMLATVWMVRRRWRMAAVFGAFAFVNAMPVLSVLWPSKQAESSTGTQLRLAVVNVHTENRRSDLVLEFLQATDADIILLMEVNERWMNDLSMLRHTYPHFIAEPREDNFGIALFSRVALTNSAVIELGEAGVPSITTSLGVRGQQVVLLGTHPLPPGSAEYARLRNDQFLEIAAHIRRRGAPVIILGDLNSTPWSPYFADLLRDTGLKNTSQGRGLFGSWPAGLPLGRIPLDHCLVPPNVHVINKWLGPHIGSDHLPVVVDLQIPTQDGSAVVK